MRWRYHQIVGRHVVTSDGKPVGWIADLVAEPRDGKLRVIGLLVGPSGLLHRVLVAGRPTGEIPWSLVASLGHDVRLRLTREELLAYEARAAEEESA